MKKKTIKIRADQYLSDILNFIENKTIYEKPTGAGITSQELKAKRHSLIIEANRPVIQGKCSQFNGRDRKNLIIRGVYEGITVSDIVTYLESDVKYKKIITTPESYPKVITAFSQLGILDELINNYFMLFDECEKTIQDIDYRDDIILPMNDFFKFKNKAFVSATPIIPSDPRFEQQKFKYVLIKPVKIIKQPVNLITTNNVFLSFQKYLQNANEDQYFIFLNSTKAIVALIEYLGIKDESMIFCSDESKSKLALNDYKNVKTLMDEKSFKKFNFFTSRFNSAVDILGITKPNIIVITDCYIAEHTKVDPNSEVIQMIGRFRKPKKGIIERKLTHIANLNPDLEYDTEEQIRKDINEMKVIHRYLVAFHDAVTSHIAKKITRELLEKTLFSKYLNKDGSINYYMIDNALFSNKVNGYYRSEDDLYNAYEESKKYIIKKNNENFVITDEQKRIINSSLDKLKTALELLIPILADLVKRGLETAEVQLELRMIEKEHPTTYKTIKAVGIERVVELKDVLSVQKEAAEIKSREGLEHFGFMGYLKNNIYVGSDYTMPQITSILRRGIAEFKLARLKPNMDLLRNYFDVSDRIYLKSKGGKKTYGYKVLKSKYNL
jgi:ribosomal protein S25/ribosomal protein S28E/S33